MFDHSGTRRGTNHHIFSICMCICVRVRVSYFDVVASKHLMFDGTSVVLVWSLCVLWPYLLVTLQHAFNILCGQCRPPVVSLRIVAVPRGHVLSATVQTTTDDRSTHRSFSHVFTCAKMNAGWLIEESDVHVFNGC